MNARTNPTSKLLLAARAAVEPLLSIADIADALSVNRRTLERMIASGAFPPPDIRVGRLPIWKTETFRGWIEKGGER